MGRKSNNEGSIRQRKDGRWEARATGGINYATGEKQRECPTGEIIRNRPNQEGIHG